MASGYTRQSSGLIVNGQTIQDSHFNNEFNAIQDFANASTGHNHDGTTGGGAPIAASGLASNAVTTAKILDANVTYAKIQNVSATDRLLGRSTAGAGVIEEIVCTSFARSLLNDATASDARVTLGLAIGSDILAYDAGLASIAALTVPADNILYSDGSDSFDYTSFTAFARSFNASTTAALARTELLAAARTQTQVFSGFISFPTDKDYKFVLKCPHAGTIVNTTTICTAGTATATFKINTTALGGTANSVTTSEQTQAHASNNAFVAGDDLVLTVSASSGITDLAFSVEFTRVYA